LNFESPPLVPKKIATKKIAMKPMNPFKFGSVVQEPYFTDRVVEQADIKMVLSSANHLIIISPRRYGKTSLIKKVVSTLERPLIFLDLQLITDLNDFASQILKRVYRVYPFERLKGFLKNFRVTPSINLNPQTNEVDVSFQSNSNQTLLLEDVFNLLDKLGTAQKKPIVVLDEFQDIKRLNPDLDKHLRAIIQHHQNINYVFMGSIESMMRQIFEEKKSPFYHFGQLMPLDKIPYPEFSNFIIQGFQDKTTEVEPLAEIILQITQCHPYYTQQLAYTVWNKWEENLPVSDLVNSTVDYLVRIHDNDYQRIWQNQNQTDKKILIQIAQGQEQLLSQSSVQLMGFNSTSTLYSGLTRLIQQGYVVKVNSKYELDDPFFRSWILRKREE
jgi:AAA+ ATPase superfamily predicted ATPase